jgi:DNA-binding Lrp family transcriptional regulator
MSETAPTIALTDPKALRAYAHPLRMSLVGLLRREGPLTATQAAERLGESVPNCSFHLRQLAKYGLAERVEGADGREKPWRATAMYTSWTSASDDPAVVEAANALTSISMERYFDRARAYLARSAAEPPAWRELTGSSDYMLYVTPEELRQLHEQIEQVIAPFNDRLGADAVRPEGARAVTFFQFTMTNEGPEE